MDHNRKSRMEPAEGSRETALENESSSDRMSEERMRNRGSSSGDLGSSSDRAMMTGRSSEERSMSEEDASSSRSSSVSSERGRGSSGERNSGDSSRSSSRSGGITNRDLDREQCEQDRLPERGRSQSER
jgi:hypothetical protein